jgi:hypothetical protein
MLFYRFLKKLSFDLKKVDEKSLNGQKNSKKYLQTFSETKNKTLVNFSPLILNMTKCFPAKILKNSKLRFIFFSLKLNIDENKTSHPIQIFSQNLLSVFY